MRRFAITLSFIALFTLTTFAQQPCKEYGPVGAVLSLCPPAGAITVKTDDGPYSGFYRETDKRNPYALVIIETPVAASLGEFGYEMISTMYSDPKFANAVLLEIGDFPSVNGVRGLRLVFAGEATQKGSTKKDQVRQIYYIYDAPKGVKIAFLAFFAASDSTAQAITDAAMKTVRIKK